MLSTTIDIVPEPIKEEILTALVEKCIGKKDTKQLSCLITSCLSDLKKSNIVFDNLRAADLIKSLLNAVENKDKISVTGLMELCSKNFDKKTFGQALFKAINKNHYSIRDEIIDNCENDNLRSMFGYALLEAALSEDRVNSMQNVISCCPKELKPLMFTKALLYAEENTDVLKNIISVCPEEIKPKVKEQVNKYWFKNIKDPLNSWRKRSRILSLLNKSAAICEVNTSAASCPDLRVNLPSFVIPGLTRTPQEIQSARKCR